MRKADLPLFWRVWGHDLLRLGAYLLVVLACVLGFWRISALADNDRAASLRADERALQQTYALCLLQRDTNLVLEDRAREIAELARDLAQRNPRQVALIDEFERKQLEAIPEVECPPITAAR